MNENCQYEDLEINPKVFKKPDQAYDKYRVYTYKKFHERL